MRNILLACAASVSLVAIGASDADAAEMVFVTTMTELNDSGGSGTATFTYDDEAQTLRVQVQATGLDDGLHLMHIHGRFDEGVDGNPIDSVTPTPQADFDTNNDGVLTVAEGLPAYGPIILPLGQTGDADTMDFPMGTTIDYDRTFDFTSADASELFAFVPETQDRYETSDLLPLVLREIVVHGVNENGEYIASLPALAGEISEVPVPAAAFLFGGVGLLTGFSRRMSKRRA